MPEYDFIALDVETANSDHCSICQVGLAFFKDGKVVDTWENYVDPATHFSSKNISIHGITPEIVKGSMLVPEMYEHLSGFLKNQIVVHHMPFDRIALCRVAQKYNRNKLDCLWLDSARLARHTWEEVRSRGYALGSLAERFSIPLNNHHNALDDAIAAGHICNLAIQKNHPSFSAWLSENKNAGILRQSDYHYESNESIQDEEYSEVVTILPAYPVQPPSMPDDPEQTKKTTRYALILVGIILFIIAFVYLLLILDLL